MLAELLEMPGYDRERRILLVVCAVGLIIARASI